MRLERRKRVAQLPEHPPLRTDDAYYVNLAKPYPRTSLLIRILRGAAGKYIPTIVAIGSMLLGLIGTIIQRVVHNGWHVLTWAYVQTQFGTWYFWQLGVTLYRYSPVLLGDAILFLVWVVVFTLWLGAIARKDLRSEKIATNWLEQQRRIAEAYSRYLGHVRDVQGQAPPLLRATGVTTNRAETMIFTPLQLEETPAIDIRGEPLGDSPADEKSEPYTQRRERRREREPRLRVSVQKNDMREALAHARDGMIVLLGEPGSGKTTVQRHLAWAYAHALLAQPDVTSRSRIPVYIDLSDVSQANLSVTERVLATVKGALKAVQMEDSAAEITDRLLLGPAILLLDGLDELSATPRQRVIQQVASYSRGRQVAAPTVSSDAPGERAAVQIAVGSRTASYRQGELDTVGFELWRLLPLRDRDAQVRLVTLVRDAWLTDAPTTVVAPPEVLLDALEAQSGAHGWSESPLLLTLATIVWTASGGELAPSNRVELYRLATAVLIRQRLRSGWDIDCNRMLDLAADIAVPWFRSGHSELTDRQVWHDIAPSLPPQYAATIAWKGETRDTVDVLLQQSGVFIRTGGDHYRAYHRTFLEYLTAYHLAQRLGTMFSRSPAAPDAVLLRLVQLGIADDPGGRPSSVDASALALLWTKRGSAEWNVVISLMVGILSEVPGRAQSPAANVGGPEPLGRPDLALAWVYALLYQPDDVGLLGLRLAAHCIAEMPDSSEARSIASECVDRFSVALEDAERRESRSISYGLSRAFGVLATSPVGVNAVIFSYFEFMDRILESPFGRAPHSWRPSFGLLVDDSGVLAGLPGHYRGPSPSVAAATAVFQQDAAAPTAADQLLPTLLHQLHDPDAITRFEAAEALSMLGPVFTEQALLLVLDELSNPDFSDQHAAMRVIGRLGARRAEAADRVLSAQRRRLSVPDGDARLAAVEALGQLGASTAEQTLPLLLVQLGDPDPDLQRAVVKALGRLGASVPAVTEQVLAILRARLGDPKDHTRQEAVEALGQLGATAAGITERVLSLLIEYLGVRDPDLQRAVVKALGRLGASVPAVTEQVLAILRARLGDPNGWTPDTDVLVLGELGALRSDVAHQILPDLIAQLTPLPPSDIGGLLNYFDIPAAAVEALGRLGASTAEQTLPLLLDRLRDPGTETLRRNLAEATQKRTGRAVQFPPDPPERTGRSTDRVTLAAVEALGRLGAGTAEQTLPLLLERLQAQNDDLRAAVVKALGYLGPTLAEQTLPLLLERLSDPGLSVRAAAIEALGRLGLSRADDVHAFLIESLADESTWVRSAALDVIESLSWGERMELLASLDTLLVEGRYTGIYVAFLQRRELESYWESGSTAAPFVTRVIALLDELPGHWSVRLHAIEFLGTIRRVPDDALRALLQIRKHDRFERLRHAADNALEAILSLDPDIPEDLEQQ